MHEGTLAGHFGILKTLSMLEQHFYWPRMLGTVGKHILRCETCKKAKLTFHKGEYRPLPAADHPWMHVSINFIVALPRTARGKDAIMVVVDRFSKMAHFLACTKTSDAKHIARLYFEEIVRLHGIPLSIVSDRDSKFLSVFWTSLWNMLGTKLLFSTAYHPQTDGQTKVTNRTLGNILRTLVSKNIKSWDIHLSHAEFAYNRCPSLTTKYSPFECIYGINPITPTTLVHLHLQDRGAWSAERQLAEAQRIHAQVHHNIVQANAKYKAKADRGFKESRHFKVGDYVWVHLRKDRFPSQRSNKLKPKADGPFPIIAKAGDNAYTVALPDSYGVSSTFNVGDLAPYHQESELRTIPFQQEGIEPNTDGSGATQTPRQASAPEITSVHHSEETLAPNLGNMEPAPNQDMGEFIMKLDTRSNQEKTLKEKEESNIALTYSAARAQDNPATSVCQGTLPDLWKAEPSTTEDLEGINGISIHGPPCQGPRTLLLITGRPSESRAKVAWSSTEHAQQFNNLG